MQEKRNTLIKNSKLSYQYKEKNKYYKQHNILENKMNQNLNLIYYQIKQNRKIKENCKN